MSSSMDVLQKPIEKPSSGPSATMRSSSSAVLPFQSEPDPPTHRRGSVFKGVEAYVTRQSLSSRQVLGCAYNWSLWGLLTVLIFAQFLGVIWNRMETTEYLLYGRSPLLGTAPIEGKNDEPYADRSIVCILQGRLYKPLQLSEALASSRAHVVDTSGNATYGYRTVTRPEKEQMTLDPAIKDFYAKRCTLIAATVDAILDSCTSLGYDVTRDHLRVVNGVDSNTMTEIPSALPILLMPYWDNAMHGRYAVPGWDGMACVFRLSGEYDTHVDGGAFMRAVNRNLREKKTLEWLGQARSGGTWRNGWYDEPNDGNRWFSDILNTKNDNEFGIEYRQFDTYQNQEINCSIESTCADTPFEEMWGTKLSSVDIAEWINSVTVSNGTHYGLFIYEANHIRIVSSVYDLETFLSNFSLGMILFRWMISMLALQNGYRYGLTRWFNAGIGCLSCSHSFHLLPIVLLPRLRMSLASFFASGCFFEGEMKPLSEAWFLIYPAIAEVMLFYYAILNLLAKALRRRMPDHLFGPSILFFCLMHRFRNELAQSKLFEFDGRVATTVTSNEFEQLQLIDFFTTDAALRMNGNIVSFLVIKLVVLAINLLPLVVFSKSTSVRGRTAVRVPTLKIERALAVRASNLGGWGMSSIYDEDEEIKDAFVMNSYELVRVGYIVYGGKYVMTIDEWYLLALLGALRRGRQATTYRIALFTIIEDQKANSKARERHIGDHPQLCLLNDPRLLPISSSHIAACAFN